MECCKAISPPCTGADRLNSEVVNGATASTSDTADSLESPTQKYPYVLLLAILSAVAVLVSNISGIATGDDGVGYRAIADSLLNGQGYGYFLERPVTIWPPIWSTLMAGVAWATPLDTMGAVILLNAAVAAAVVVVGNRLLRLFVSNTRLVLLGTLVLAFGPSTIGLGHVLMTDMAFALLLMAWILTLIRFRSSGSVPTLILAGLLVWVGFGLRYIGLVLIAFGGLWLLLDRNRSWLVRIRNGAIYGAVSFIAPGLWMARNYSIDETFTGERHPSARGLVDNGFDIAATLGRFLLPGLGNGLTKIWAAVGLSVLAVAIYLAWRLLRVPRPETLGASGNPSRELLSTGAVVHRLVAIPGTTLGLLLFFPILYMVYMLYVRTTTALNQLDLRLLYPAYFPLMFLALALIDRLPRLNSTAETAADPASESAAGARTGSGSGSGSDTSAAAAQGNRWWKIGYGGAHVWAAANLAAGCVAMVAFAAGHPYFIGNYEANVFEQVRANPAIEALPANCRLYSNLPNGLYPAYEAQWSPQRRALESSEEIPDLQEITTSLASTESCLIWIDEPPIYGHLWTLEQLKARLSLTELASNGNVSVYRMQPPR